jgi:hypothetical protein
MTSPVEQLINEGSMMTGISKRMKGVTLPLTLVFTVELKNRNYFNSYMTAQQAKDRALQEIRLDL